MTEFLATKPEDLQGLKGARTLASHFSRMNLKPPKGDAKGKEKAAWQAFLKESSDSCEPVWSMAPKAKAALDDLTEEIKRNLNSNTHPSGYYMLNDFRYNLPQICRVLTGKETKEDLANSHPYQECRVATGSSSTNEIAFLNRSIISSLKKEPDDFEAIVSGVLQDIKQISPRIVLDPRSPCQYDPFASLQMVEKILNLDCVETVFVPDNFLIHRLPQQRGRVLHKVFLEDDRFAIRLKPVCKESKSLWERLPHTAR